MEPAPSFWTIWCHLQTAGLHCRQPVKKILISVKNWKTQIAWAECHLYWSQTDLNDENEFLLFGTVGIKWVRRPGVRDLIQSTSYQLPSIKENHFWGCDASLPHEWVPRTMWKVLQTPTSIMSTSMYSNHPSPNVQQWWPIVESLVSTDQGTHQTWTSLNLCGKSRKDVQKREPAMLLTSSLNWSRHGMISHSPQLTTRSNQHLVIAR